VIPTLTTPRLILRGWREADWDGLNPIYADALYARFIGGKLSREDTWRLMAQLLGHWSLRGYGVWALEARESGAFVGYAGLWNPAGWPEPEVCWTLVPAAQGRGFATEAAERARIYSYAGLGWPTLISLIAPDNAPSLRVAERLGARLESTFSQGGGESGIFRHPPASSFRFVA
jgi:RimJ/RimL family protein N-acetyltransferase